MKKQSVSLYPRALIGFVPRSIGILLALLVFVAFPSSSALATQCEEVYFDETGGLPFNMYVYLYCDTSGSTIFVKYNNNYFPSDPTHSGSTPTNGTSIWAAPYFTVPPGGRLYIKALCYKAGLTDSAVTQYAAENY